MLEISIRDSRIISTSRHPGRLPSHMNTAISAPLQLYRRPKVAVVIPCHNEACIIAKVVRDFRSVLPDATVYVYDNASTDSTSSEALSAGAVVRTEPLVGKGNVLRRMFADIEADVFLMIDGDDTYDVSIAPRLIETLIENSLDMVNAARIPMSTQVYRRGHKLGNTILSQAVAKIFGGRVNDMLSGYRALSRRLVKSFPAVSAGFEIETELTVHALELRLPITELPVRYKERPEGSKSKLKTYRDGFRILKFIIYLIKQEKPLQFFGWIFIVLTLITALLEFPIVLTFVRTGLVPRLPTAVLGLGIGILAFISLTCGLILDTVTRGLREAKRMHYLSLGGTGFTGTDS